MLGQPPANLPRELECDEFRVAIVEKVVEDTLTPSNGVNVTPTTLGSNEVPEKAMKDA